MPSDVFSEPTAEYQSVLIEFREQVAECCCVFHQLTFLASHRDHAGMYWPPDRGMNPGIFARVARQLHELIFEEWLAVPLIDQYQEVRTYLAKLSDGRPTILFSMLRSEAGAAALIPENAIRAQRDLFLSDLRIVMSLLQCQLTDFSSAISSTNHEQFCTNCAAASPVSVAAAFTASS
jgi:hypothetical protein